MKATGAGMSRDPNATGRLRQAGLRRTPVRRGVLEVLAASDHPLSVTQILGKMKDVDSVTVYRTLNTFVEKDLVHRVRGEDRSWLYALSDNDSDERPQHQHPHFVCERCGAVECLESAEIPEQFVKSLGIQRGYQVSYPEVILHGVCPRCGS